MVALDTCKHCQKSRRLTEAEVRTARGRLSLTLHKKPLGASDPAANSTKPAKKKPIRRARPQAAARRAERKQPRRATYRIPRDPVSHRRIVRPAEPQE